MVSPNISADVEVADKTVLYLNATCKLNSNSMYDLFVKPLCISYIQTKPPSPQLAGWHWNQEVCCTRFLGLMFWRI